jgi:hypothetical protein
MRWLFVVKGRSGLWHYSTGGSLYGYSPTACFKMVKVKGDMVLKERFDGQLCKHCERIKR